MLQKSIEDVAKTPYLVPPDRRCPFYYFRKAVPEHLRKIIGETEYLDSLGTADFKTAKSLCLAKAVEVEKELKQADVLLEQASAKTENSTVKFGFPLKVENARELVS